MGAWVEIIMLFSKLTVLLVAPCVGAWVEITIYRVFKRCYYVAPCVGAWVEIGNRDKKESA